jgi:hypothetical protein
VNRQKYMYRNKLYYSLKSKEVDEINSNLFLEKGEPSYMKFEESYNRKKNHHYIYWLFVISSKLTLFKKYTYYYVKLRTPFFPLFDKMFVQ